MSWLAVQSDCAASSVFVGRLALRLGDFGGARASPV